MTNLIHYRHALDAMPQLVWVARPDGTLEYLNRRCAEYTGLPVDDLLGWDWAWVVHPTDLPETMRIWKAAVLHGTPYSIEQRFRRHDGEFRWFLCRAEPVRDTAGAIQCWVGTCTDVDESRRTGDLLRNMRVQFRALVERCEEGLVLAGSDGSVRYANRTAAEFLDYAPDELVGTDLWGSVHPEDRPELLNWLDGLGAAPGARVSITLRFVQRRGSSRRLTVFGSNLMPDPEVRGIAVRLRPAETAQ